MSLIVQINLSVEIRGFSKILFPCLYMEEGEDHIPWLLTSFVTWDNKGLEATQSDWVYPRNISTTISSSKLTHYTVFLFEFYMGNILMSFFSAILHCSLCILRFPTRPFFTSTVPWGSPPDSTQRPSRQPGLLSLHTADGHAASKAVPCCTTLPSSVPRVWTHLGSEQAKPPSLGKHSKSTRPSATHGTPTQNKLRQRTAAPL